MKGDGTTAFQVTHDGPTRRGRCPQVVVPSCQRPAHGKRAPGRTPAHRAIMCSLCGPVAGRRNTEWKAWSISSVTMSSLRWPRNDAAVSAKGALSTRAFVSWLRRHGKSGSVLSRAAPSAVRRRRNMNCYFHISTVFRMRREALRVFFAIRAGAGLRRDFRKVLWNKRSCYF